MSDQTKTTPSAKAAKIFRSVREQKNYRQQDVAQCMLMPRSALSALEHGKRDITLDEFINLCDVLRVDPNSVFQRVIA